MEAIYNLTAAYLINSMLSVVLNFQNLQTLLQNFLNARIVCAIFVKLSGSSDIIAVFDPKSFDVLLKTPRIKKDINGIFPFERSN